MGLFFMTILKKPLAIFIFMFVFSSVYLIYTGYRNIIDSHEQAKTIIDSQETKHRLVTKLYIAARERSLILLTMHSTTDVFELDELSQKMSEQATDYIRAREKLVSMPMSKEEQSIYEEKSDLVNMNVSFQNQVVALFLEGNRKLAENIMFNKAIPGQRLVLDKITEVLELYESTSESVMAEIDANHLQATKEFKLLLLSVLIVSLLFSVIVVQMSRREKLKIKKATDDMTYLASHDSLTGLLNRWAFERHLAKLIECNDEPDVHYVLYLDLDRFKVINDACGHYAGDEVLKDISGIIKSCVRKEDMVARIGGDEFCIVLQSCNEIPAKETANSLVKAIDDYRCYYKNKVFHLGASIGMVNIGSASRGVEVIMQEIDSACYVAKDNGGSRYHQYSNNSRKILQRKVEMNWFRKIECALENDDFVLYAQPIVPVCMDDARVNYEILIRMKNDNGDLILPNKFLPSAERYNKIVLIDRWVIKNAFIMLSGSKRFLQSIDYCSINVSCQSLTDDDFFDFVIEELTLHPFLAKKICFEITETAAISNPLKANRCISVLRDMGVRFALDDFGCGLASFEYLKTLSVDYLKIDGMFIKDIVHDPIDRAMVRSIHEVGKVMNKIIIAEFVENNEILEELKIIGVDYAQGYGVGKPKPLFSTINALPVDDVIPFRHARNSS